MLRTITILNTQRAKSSNSGNPSYYVTYLESALGEKHYGTAITGTNCSVGYEINNYIGCTLLVNFSNRRKLNLPVINQIKALRGKQQ